MAAGLRVERVLGPLESPINAFPFGETWRRTRRARELVRTIVHEPTLLVRGPAAVRAAAHRQPGLPGRLFTFAFVRP